MLRRIAVLASLAVIMFSVPVALGATWQYEGTSAWTHPLSPASNDEMQDWNHLRRYDMVVDDNGNVFVNAGDGRNWDTIDTNTYAASPGGVTIFKPDGLGGWTQTDIDLTPTGLDIPGGITKMVVAGDGKVYALQNYHPPGNDWCWYPWWMLTDGNPSTGCSSCKIRSRILRINLDGSVDIIDEQSPPILKNENWVNLHGGLTVGGDGHVYWWLAGAQFDYDTYYREHVLWRYNVTTQTVEESPTGGTNNGWEWMPFFHILEYVGTSPDGTMWLCPVKSVYQYLTEFGPTAMAWDINRRNVSGVNELVEGRNDPLVELEWDPAFNKLWIVARGQSGSCIARRYNGDPAKPALFDNPVTTPDPDTGEYIQTGIVDEDRWHANGNDPGQSGVPNNGDYWVTDMAVNPANGAAWMSFGAVGTYDYTGTYGLLGPVYTVGRNDTAPTGDEGTPQSAHPTKSANASRTLALAFHGDKVYALAFDLVSREFNLFSATNPATSPGACCEPDNVCSEVTEGECAVANGVYMGIGTSCGSVDCAFRACNSTAADADGDLDVDITDFGIIQRCATYSTGWPIEEYPPVNCSCFDFNGDDAIDGADIDVFVNCANGPGNTPACP